MRLFGVFILALASLSNALVDRYEYELGTCLDTFDVNENTIIRTQDSRLLGAKFINESDLSSKEDCLRLCCETSNCNVMVYEEKKSGSCYLFDCGSPDDFRCKFTQHEHYTSAILSVNRHSLDLDKWSSQSKHEQELTNLRTKDVVPLKPQSTVPPAPPPPPPPPPITTSPLPVKDIPPLAVATKTTVAVRRCNPYQFECRSTGECLAIYNACDGIPQCSDGSDEGPELGCPNNADVNIAAIPTQPMRLFAPPSVPLDHSSVNRDRYNNNNDNNNEKNARYGQSVHHPHFQQPPQQQPEVPYLKYPPEESPSYREIISVPTASQQQKQLYGPQQQKLEEAFPLQQQLQQQQQQQQPLPPVDRRPIIMEPMKMTVPVDGLRERGREGQLQMGIPQQKENIDDQWHPPPPPLENNYGNSGPPSYEDESGKSVFNHRHSGLLEEGFRYSPYSEMHEAKHAGRPMVQKRPPSLPQQQQEQYVDDPYAIAAMNANYNYYNQHQQQRMNPPNNINNNNAWNNRLAAEPNARREGGGGGIIGNNNGDGGGGGGGGGNGGGGGHPSKIPSQYDMKVMDYNYEDDTNGARRRGGLGNKQPQMNSSAKKILQDISAPTPTVATAPPPNKTKVEKLNFAHVVEDSISSTKHSSGNSGGGANQRISQLHVSVAQLEVETSRDSNQSSGAVLALTLGLSITGLLLVLVGCRLRSVRRRLGRHGRSPYAHDADYLVNGMYL